MSEKNVKLITFAEAAALNFKGVQWREERCIWEDVDRFLMSRNLSHAIGLEYRVKPVKRYRPTLEPFGTWCHNGSAVFGNHPSTSLSRISEDISLLLGTRTDSTVEIDTEKMTATFTRTVKIEECEV